MLKPTIVAAAGVIACLGTTSMRVLEFDDVQDFSIVVHQVDGVTTSLEIAGLVFHSALVVDRMEANPEGATLRVRVFLAPVGRGKSGRFRFILQLPSDVDQVVFGDHAHLVWKRGG